MATAPAKYRATCIDASSMDQEFVTGLYNSTESKLEVPSLPPTTYNKPSNATTPILNIKFKFNMFKKNVS